MPWIREDELQGQKVLDEAEFWNMRYVKIEDGKNTISNNRKTKKHRKGK